MGGTWAKSKARAVYVHIPFCTNKCFYCDFNSYVVDGQPVDRYLDALEQELIQVSELHPPDVIDTIFVGGGTPTVLDPLQMKRLCAMIRNSFPNLSENYEWTMEANPGTTDREKLAAMLAGGVNRISFGAQSFDAEELQRIGRIHQPGDVIQSIANARAEGFQNLSVDLMFGLPNQTVQRFQENVERALSLDLPHYSVYSLKVEEHTLFHTLYERGQLPLPSEDEEVDMYRFLLNRMQQAGRIAYEVSNFAKVGFESKHNTTYWRNESYYGLGAGAHGYLRGKRHWNIKAVQGYIDAALRGLPIAEQTEISLQDAMEDFWMVGLRLRDGAKESDFRKQFDREAEDVFGSVLERLLQDGLLARRDDLDGYCLTERGLWLGNDVFARFLGINS